MYGIPFSSIKNLSSSTSIGHNELKTLFPLKSVIFIAAISGRAETFVRAPTTEQYMPGNKNHK